MHNVVIADTHAIFRETLRYCLDNLPAYHVMGEADSADGVISQLNESIDILILELYLKNDDVFSLIKHIRHEYPQLKVVVLSMYSEANLVRKAISSGVDAYVSKSSNISQLCTALQKVLSNNKYLSQNITEVLLNSLDQKADSLHELLTDRELEIFTMLGRGLSNNKIASQLTLSAKTVSTHKRRVMQKMHLSSNAAIIKYFLNLDNKGEQG